MWRSSFFYVLILFIWGFKCSFSIFFWRIYFILFGFSDSILSSLGFGFPWTSSDDLPLWGMYLLSFSVWFFFFQILDCQWNVIHFTGFVGELHLDRNSDNKHVLTHIRASMLNTIKIRFVEFYLPQSGDRTNKVFADLICWSLSIGCYTKV